PGHRLVRYVRLVPIAKHEGLAAIAELPRLTVSDRAVIIIQQRHGHSRRRIPHGGRLRFDLLRLAVGSDRRCEFSLSNHIDDLTAPECAAQFLAQRKTEWG